jgi:hypothetical protein
MASIPRAQAVSVEEMPVESGNNRPMQRTAAAIALVLTLALPGVALAQSAGDQQYYDPLAGSSPSPHRSPARAPAQTPQQAGSAPTTAPQQVAQASPGQQTAATKSSGDPATGGNQLPRTGFPALLLAAMGATFLVAGGTLRRGASEPQLPDAPPYLHGGALTRAAARRRARRLGR